MAAVVFYMEDDSTKVQRLETESTAVGRHPDNDVILTCPSSSSRHAVIKQSGDDVYVQDLGSSNGTRVNGAEVEEAKLKDGDRIGFGDVQAIFYAGEPPSMDQILAKAAAIVIGLFVCAFIVGLSLRHMKEMNGNFITDFMGKLFEKVPTIKVERQEGAK